MGVLTLLDLYFEYLTAHCRIWPLWWTQGDCPRTYLYFCGDGIQWVIEAPKTSYRYTLPATICFSGDIQIVYSGYIPGAEALSIVQGRVTELRGANPSLIYLLDRKSTI